MREIKRYLQNKKVIFRQCGQGGSLLEGDILAPIGL